jgi:murein DD-endopeptidase MepM/ murein hydrolase activator NlpD
MAMLVEAGAGRRDAYDAIVAMSEVFKPRYLMPGQEISVTLRPSTVPDVPDALVSIKLIESVERDVVVRRGDDGSYVAEIIDHPLTVDIAAGEGVIEASLFLAGEAAGIPPGVLALLIQVYSFDVDFQRDIRKGDGFSVMYERYLDENGNVVRSGNILRASMTLSGKQRSLYRFVTAKGVTDYYDDEGKSARRTLMRTPINGARLSSGFGNRRHPILGFTKMHTGTDFAAPRGTPIYAAGNGTVELAGRKGGYGLYVRLRHNGTYKTAYGHMSGIARGVRRGKRVTQGQVIGYVGSTGRSTGNHLHYEVLRNGRFINSRRMHLPSGKALKGADLEAFQLARGEADERFAALTGDAVQFAASEDGETPGCGGPAGAC